MHPKFLSYLCCPKTHCELRLFVDEYFVNGMVKTGRLETVEGKSSYPIINGIPRFVSKELYASSFGYEWLKWPRVQFESENTESPMKGHTTKMFKAITHFRKDDIKGKKVLDYGCGAGRFLDIIRLWGGIAVGIDLSVAVESARVNFRDDENVLIVQGDILNPPFKKGYFDFGYTIGVLHHTPSPLQGLQALCEMVKKNGIIACSVYSKEGFYSYPSVYSYRKFVNAAKMLLGDNIGNKIALFYAFFSSYILYYVFKNIRRIPFIGSRFVHIIEKYFLVNLNLLDKRWRLLDVFDAITPRYASTHTFIEIRSWFEDSGCIAIEKTNWGSTSVKAKKG